MGRVVFWPAALGAACCVACPVSACAEAPDEAAPIALPVSYSIAASASDADEVTVPANEPYRLSTFGKQTGSVGLEVVAVAAVMASTRVDDLGQGFRFKNEGWFGKSTATLGMDKLHHGWKTYVVSDILQSIIERKTGDAKGAAITGSVLGLGLMTYAEVLDGFSKGSGFSEQDSIVHVAGAGISLLRNTVPGMRDKVDFRMEIEPSLKGNHRLIADQLVHRKYLVALQLSGFKGLETSPLRFLELHAGYYATGIASYERARNDPLRQKPYLGIGFNVQALFSKKPNSTAERIAKGVFDYIQLPYTSVRTN